MADNKLGETLKTLRIYKGINQKVVSQELNITRQTYSNYETGRRVPDIGMLCRLADYYGVTLDQLIVTGLDPSPKELNLDSLSYLLPKDYCEVISAYHKLSPKKREQLREYLRVLGKMKEMK